MAACLFFLRRLENGKKDFKPSAEWMSLSRSVELDLLICRNEIGLMFLNEENAMV